MIDLPGEGGGSNLRAERAGRPASRGADVVADASSRRRDRLLAGAAIVRGRPRLSALLSDDVAVARLGCAACAVAAAWTGSSLARQLRSASRWRVCELTVFGWFARAPRPTGLPWIARLLLGVRADLHRIHRGGGGAHLTRANTGGGRPCGAGCRRRGDVRRTEGRLRSYSTHLGHVSTIGLAAAGRRTSDGAPRRHGPHVRVVRSRTRASHARDDRGERSAGPAKLDSAVCRPSVFAATSGTDSLRVVRLHRARAREDRHARRRATGTTAPRPSRRPRPGEHQPYDQLGPTSANTRPCGLLKRIRAESGCAARRPRNTRLPETSTPTLAAEKSGTARHSIARSSSCHEDRRAVDLRLVRRGGRDTSSRPVFRASKTDAPSFTMIGRRRLPTHRNACRRFLDYRGRAALAAVART